MTEELYTLEHSQYSEDSGAYPFHVGTFTDAVKLNLQDYFYNNRGANKWQILYIGTREECFDMLEHFEAKKVKAWEGPVYA
jgi:hypothetical protein